MRSFATWAFAFGFFGVLLAGLRGVLWWPLGLLAGVGAAICFTGASKTLSRVLGEPLGWTAGGLIGLGLGGSLLLCVIGRPSAVIGRILFGALGGVIAGAICGPICGGTALASHARNGQYAGKTSRAIFESVIMLAAFLLGLVAIGLVVIYSGE